MRNEDLSVKIGRAAYKITHPRAWFLPFQIRKAKADAYDELMRQAQYDLKVRLGIEKACG